MWYAEKQVSDRHGGASERVRLGVGPWGSQERAKGECRKDLRAHPQNAHRVTYRIVRDDPRSTIDAESLPPYGSRMAWRIT